MVFKSKLEYYKFTVLKYITYILTDFNFRQQKDLADNQNYQAESRPLCNKIPLCYSIFFQTSAKILKLDDLIKNMLLQPHGKSHAVTFKVQPLLGY